MEHLITVAEAAELLGISREAVRRLCLRGQLSYVRKGGRRFVNVDSVRRHELRRARANATAGRRC